MAGKPEVDARLQRLLGGSELTSLRRRLRRHFEHQSVDAPVQWLHLSKLSEGEYEALCLLTGRPASAAQSMRLDLPQLDAALRAAGLASSLRAALEMIDGPIEDRVATAAARLKRWTTLTTADSLHPSLKAWLQFPAASGLLKRMAHRDPDTAQQLLARATAVLSRLPARGIARAQLAAETLGNAHALDAGQAVATLVLAVWRQGEQLTPSLGASLERSCEAPQEPPVEERARDIWARAGVLVNELARPALFLNLPTRNGTWCTGEPGYLSLRRLLRAPPQWHVFGLPIFVCENPNLVAIAADHLGTRCAPLVCTEGMPAAAQRTLLRQLQQAGAQLRYHGDFDWPGVRIANHVMRICQARSWRFDTHDYEAAASNAPDVAHDLAATPVAASWDAELAPMMLRHGVSIPEEAVAGCLLEDLDQATGGGTA